MKNLILIAVFSIISFSVYSQSELTGKWNTGDQNTIVKIEKENDVYIGKALTSDNPKARPGTLLIKDAKLKKGKWEGKMYAPKKGEWYDAVFVQKQNRLEITISVGFFTKTVEWIKVKS